MSIGVFMPMVVGGSVPPHLEFCSTEYFYQSGGTSTHTYPNMSLGTASPDRLVVIGVFTHRASSAFSIVSAAANGVSLNLIDTITNAGASNSVAAAVFAGLVPSGTVGTITVTHSTSSNVTRSRVGVWALTGTNGSSLASATSSNADFNSALPLTMVKTGCVLLVSGNFRNTGVADVTLGGIGTVDDFKGYTTATSRVFAGRHQNNTPSGLITPTAVAASTSATLPVSISVAW